jgi:ribosome-associated toxin RatA of RatAB toxin-antitoxin module
MVAALVIASSLVVHAADPGKAHSHTGVLAAYPVPPIPIALDSAQEAQFSSGDPVYTQVDTGSQGRGVAVFLVKAPADEVWSTIHNFAAYPKWIDGLETCEVYKQSGDHVYVRFVIEKMGMDIEYFIDHTFPPGETWGTWTLDYTRESDLDDSVGMWRVTSLPDNPGHSRVEYSVDVKVTGWVPGFVRDFLVNRGLRDATSWVKKQSEQ